MGRKYPIVKAGEWVTPARKVYRMVCCDCGLVHIFEMKTVPNPRGRGREIMWRAWRDNRSTGQIRRYKKEDKAG